MASDPLALLKREAGSAQVAQAVASGAALSTVNLCEVVAKLTDGGMTETAIRAAIGSLDLQLFDFDAELGHRAGLLRTVSRSAGLSLGDRSCLALAERLGVPALTADRSWASLHVSVTVRVIR